MDACTVVAANYLPFARVLASSYAATNGGRRVTVLLLDDDGTVAASSEPFDVLRPEDVGVPPDDLEQMSLLYDAKELATALKPWLLASLLDRGRGPVLFLDPDIEVFDDLAWLASLAAEHGIALTPHALEPLPEDGRTPTERHVRRSGIFNGGFVAVGGAARPFLEWWASRLRWDCVVSAREGLFVDQRWLDFVPAYFPHTIVRDPGCNVAYWNLHERDVSDAADGGYVVDGVPLRFFHFSGFDPRAPHRLTRVADRITLADRPAVARLCRDYAARLLDAGYVDWIGRPYGLGRDLPRFRLRARDRRLYREAVLASVRNDAAASAALSPDAVVAGDVERRLPPLRRAGFLLDHGDRRDPASRGAAIRLLRRLAARLAVPHAEEQRQVELALVAALEELDERLRALEARLARVERPPAEE